MSSQGAEWASIPRAWRDLYNELNGGRIPDGTPGIRDVDAPCEAFQPGVPGHGKCETDGHYICEECTEIAERELRRRRDQCEDCGAALERTKFGLECPVGCYETPAIRRERASLARALEGGASS